MGMGLVPLARLCSPPRRPTPLLRRRSLPRLLRPNSDGGDEPLSHTHTSTHIHIYKGVHPPPLRSIPFRTIPRGGDVADGSFGTIPDGLREYGV
ncbi:hypothetical protein HanRHA438_Chr17g0837281 [Helianthus annuus]|nr:hypothetical protein HanRHA438_Chr17g0837281 [Helianthus annuus]